MARPSVISCDRTVARNVLGTVSGGCSSQGDRMGATMHEMTVEPSDTGPVGAEARPRRSSFVGPARLGPVAAGRLGRGAGDRVPAGQRRVDHPRVDWRSCNLDAVLSFRDGCAVILARRPGNRIGWLCWAIGFAITVSFWGSKPVWAVLADQSRSGSLGGAPPAWDHALAGGAAGVAALPRPSVPYRSPAFATLATRGLGPRAGAWPVSDRAAVYPWLGRFRAP